MTKEKKRLKKCRFCGYKWPPRVENPKSCPRCKERFDRPAPGYSFKNLEVG